MSNHPATDPTAPQSPGGSSGPTQLTMQILQPVRFRLEFGQREPLSLALYRVCLREIDDAIASLRETLDPLSGIHNARKSMKRLRAMLRLVRDEIGHEIYRSENVVLRDVARVLSPARSAQVLAGLARELTTALHEIVPEAAAQHLVETLEARSLDHVTAVLDDEQQMTDVMTTLLTARVRFESWPVVDTDLSTPDAPRHRIPDDFSVIEPGIRRVYRRGRRAMHRAVDTPTEQSFHEWRKRAKYLRYQMEALHLIWPEVVGGLAEALDSLGETLGDEHDLAELGHLIIARHDLVPDSNGRRLLLVEIARRRLALQSVALRLGQTIYHEPPRRFTARLGVYWAAAHS